MNHTLSISPDFHVWKPKMEQQLIKERIVEWLNTLVGLAQWDKRLPSYLARLFRTPDQYAAALASIRQGINHPAQADPKAPEGLTADEWQKLYSGVTRAVSVRQRFASGQDPLEGATYEQISVLADLSDLTADPQTMAYSTNEAFLDVLGTLRQSPTLNPEQKIREGLETFLFLYETDQAITDMLNELAGSGDWHVVLASLKDNRDYTERGGTSAAAALRRWNAKLWAQTPHLNIPTVATTDLRPALVMISRAPKHLVRMAWEGRHLFADAQMAIVSADPAKSAIEERKQKAAAALPLFRNNYAKELAAIEAELRLLEIVALNHIQVRKFAKLDAFVYTWPKVAMLAMANYPNLEYVEDSLVNRRQRPSDTELDAKEVRELFDLCAKDAGLTRFLRLRPYFSEIDENELRRYKPLAPVVLTETAAAASTAAAATSSSTTKPAPKAVSYQPTYTCYLKIEPTVGSATSGEVYEVTLSLPDGSLLKSEAKFWTASLLAQILKIVGVSSEDALQPILKDLFSSPGGAAEGLLARAGTHLLNTLLGNGQMRKQFDELLNTETSIRIVVQTGDREELTYLPCEWLPRPNLPELLVRDSRYSIVRCRSVAEIITPPPLSLPLRLMTIFQGERGDSIESSESVHALQADLPKEQVQLYNILSATVQTVEQTLKSFAPQVVHFVGKIDFFLTKSGMNAPGIRFADLPMIAPDFAKMLTANQVQLLVIGHNGFGYLSDNPIAAMAARLVDDGLPAVVAPVRGVDDVSAITFTTELYRAFLQGNTLEAAICIARRKLASKGGDWSAFALFGNPNALNYFQLFSVST